MLDIGCGTGAVLKPASERAAAAVGIELSPGMAERARAAAPTAEVVVGDASQLPFESESFDVALAAFVVFFMRDPTAALKDWARVIKPGGRIAISTWAESDPRWAWEREVRMPFAAHIDRERMQELMSSVSAINRFDEPQKLANELSAAGFEPTGVETFPLEFVFKDEDAWWEWNWSHATRIFLEELPEDIREQYRAKAYEAMQENREGDGFPRRYIALFAGARRP